MLQARLLLESVVAAQAREPNGGLIAMPDPFQTVHRAGIISRAARHRLPSVYAFRVVAKDGGLLSYGNDRSITIDLRRIVLIACFVARSRANFPSRPRT